MRFAFEALGAAVIFALAPAVSAESLGDGREGPTPFSGAALDAALTDLNAFIARRDTAEALIAGPAEPAATLAVAPPDLGYGPAIGDGRALDLHLAALQEEISRREERLFLLISRAAGGQALDPALPGGVPDASADAQAFGPPVSGDASLDAQMRATFEHMIDQATRAARLAPASPDVVTGSSFDRYGAALALY